MGESEMRMRSWEEAGGSIGKAMRSRYQKLRSDNDIEWSAIRDVLLPTLLDIADELDALRRERGRSKRGR